MATLKTTVANTWNPAGTQVQNLNNNTDFITKYVAFLDGQKSNRTLWFFISLMVHATVFLPLPILLVGYFNAPVAIIGVTMVAFFANFVANMGGSGVRVTLSFFLASAIIHLIMLFAVLSTMA